MPVLQTLAVANYRSIRSLVMPLSQLNLITGANGSGKSSLYRALRLLAEAAQGGIVSSLAREGGLSSTLWAGPETISRAMKKGTVPVQGGPRKEPVHLRLGFQGEHVGYAIDLGLPIPSSSAFTQDPEIKRECVWGAPALRPSSLLADRRGPAVRLRRADGEWDDSVARLPTFESMLSVMSDPDRAPELLALREEVAVLALLRSLPRRRRRAGTPHADRNAHSGTGARWPRSRRGAADHPRNWRSSARSAPRWTTLSRVRPSMWNMAAASSPCCSRSMDCCVR